MTDYMDAHLVEQYADEAFNMLEKVKYPIERKSFCNSSIKPLRENKPHIVLRGDYWRVSKMFSFKESKYYSTEKLEYFSMIYSKAYCFVNTLNAKRFE